MEEKLKVEEAAFLAQVNILVESQKKYDKWGLERALLNDRIKKVRMQEHDLKRQMVEDVKQLSFSPEYEQYLQKEIKNRIAPFPQDTKEWEHFEFIIEEVWLSKEKDLLYYYYCSSVQGKKWIFEEMVELYSGGDGAIALITREEREKINAFVLERRKTS